MRAIDSPSSPPSAYRDSQERTVRRLAWYFSATADQLGHANTFMTTDVYFGRKHVATGAAAVLEALDA